MEKLKTLFQHQFLANGYELIDGVQMHELFGDRFQIPNWWFRKYVAIGHFVELRVDSSRFGVPNPSSTESRPHVGNELSKPILCHDEPSTLEPTPRRLVPSRGWGEQFWVQITERDGRYLRGVVDNPLYESRLHGLFEGDSLLFTENHILAIHTVHNRKIMNSMAFSYFVDFMIWLRSSSQQNHSEANAESQERPD